MLNKKTQYLQTHVFQPLNLPRLKRLLLLPQLLLPLLHLTLVKIRLNSLKLHSLHQEGPRKRAFFFPFCRKAS
jgi:hypothetical protein